MTMNSGVFKDRSNTANDLNENAREVKWWRRAFHTEGEARGKTSSNMKDDGVVREPGGPFEGKHATTSLCSQQHFFLVVLFIMVIWAQ